MRCSTVPGDAYGAPSQSWVVSASDDASAAVAAPSIAGHGGDSVPAEEKRQ